MIHWLVRGILSRTLLQEHAYRVGLASLWRLLWRPLPSQTYKDEWQGAGQATSYIVQYQASRDVCVNGRGAVLLITSQWTIRMILRAWLQRWEAENDFTHCVFLKEMTSGGKFPKKWEFIPCIMVNVTHTKATSRWPMFAKIIVVEQFSEWHVTTTTSPLSTRLIRWVTFLRRAGPGVWARPLPLSAPSARRAPVQRRVRLQAEQPGTQTQSRLTQDSTLGNKTPLRWKMDEALPFSVASPPVPPGRGRHHHHHKWWTPCPYPQFRWKRSERDRNGPITPLIPASVGL